MCNFHWDYFSESKKIIWQIRCCQGLSYTSGSQLRVYYKTSGHTLYNRCCQSLCVNFPGQKEGGNGSSCDYLKFVWSFIGFRGCSCLKYMFKTLRKNPFYYSVNSGVLYFEMYNMLKVSFLEYGFFRVLIHNVSTYCSKVYINTKKYHVFAPMGRFQLEIIYLYFPPSSQLVYLCFCPVGLSLL